MVTCQLEADVTDLTRQIDDLPTTDLASLLSCFDNDAFDQILDLSRCNFVPAIDANTSHKLICRLRLLSDGELFGVSSTVV